MQVYEVERRGKARRGPAAENGVAIRLVFTLYG